ncbi:hypothetical protein MTO96_031507 [Rhipicephalus appendiculatus]
MKCNYVLSLFVSFIAFNADRTHSMMIGGGGFFPGAMGGGGLMGPGLLGGGMAGGMARWHDRWPIRWNGRRIRWWSDGRPLANETSVEQFPNATAADGMILASAIHACGKLLRHCARKKRPYILGTERPMSPVYFLFPWAAHKCPAGNKNFDKCAVNDAEHCPNAVGYCCHGVCLCVHSKIIFCPRLQKPHYFIGAH